MGRFSTTVHVKDNVGRIEFINSFCGIMKNHGFVPCSEDEAEQSYVFAFGDGWVTLVNKDYKDDRLKAGDDAMNMSAALKTSALRIFTFSLRTAARMGLLSGTPRDMALKNRKEESRNFGSRFWQKAKHGSSSPKQWPKMQSLSRKLWWRWRRNSKLIRITFTRISMG